MILGFVPQLAGTQASTIGYGHERKKSGHERILRTASTNQTNEDESKLARGEVGPPNPTQLSFDSGHFFDFFCSPFAVSVRVGLDPLVSVSNRWCSFARQSSLTSFSHATSARLNAAGVHPVASRNTRVRCA